MPSESTAPYEWPGAVIVDEMACGFYIQDGYWAENGDYCLEVICRNSTESLCMFSLENIVVSGYLADSFWGQEIQPMEIGNYQIRLAGQALSDSGISSADEIRFELRIFDMGEMQKEYLWSSEEKIYPTGLKSIDVKYPQPPQWAQERIFADNDYCTYAASSTMESGNTLRCFLENKTARPLQFTWYNTYVNGEYTEPFWSMEIPARSRCCTKITLDQAQTVDELEFHLYVFQNDQWFAQAVVNDVFVWTP